MTLIEKDICKLLTMKSSDMNNSVHLKSILTVSEVLIKYKELSVVLSPVLRDSYLFLTVKLINMMSYLKTVGKIKTLLDIADLS